MIAGTRGSALALWQTEHVVRLLGEPVKVETIVTRGDVDRTSRLQGKIDKGFFTVELETALREGKVDFAVHSLKDLPTKEPEDLTVAAVLERAAPNDRLLIRGDSLKHGARVGASSLRREALLKVHYPKAQAALLRGNVPTRVKKLQAGEYDAIVLAAAGLNRLGLDTSGLTVVELDPKIWIPAPGQGAIAVQCRRSDEKTRASLARLTHAPTARAVHLERELLRVFEGGCSAPFGAYCDGKTLWVGADVGGTWRTLTRPARETLDDELVHATIDALTKQ